MKLMYLKNLFFTRAIRQKLLEKCFIIIALKIRGSVVIFFFKQFILRFSTDALKLIKSGSEDKIIIMQINADHMIFLCIKET